ncbi:hypothetical protein AAVH_35131, partial [Aphelenchoides avenae]
LSRLANNDAPLHEQINASLTLPFERLHGLKRNQSLRQFQLQRNKMPEAAHRILARDDHAELAHGLIQRTKHLSLKLHRNIEKQQVPAAAAMNNSDCRIS